MSRPHPLSALTEREWEQAWLAEQERLDHLKAQRGSWLPNVVETRTWGAIRWTSGRPAQTATSGKAVGESFAVLKPDLADQAVRERMLSTLRERPPVVRLLGFSLRAHHLRGGLVGALVTGVLAAAAAVAVVGLSAVVVPSAGLAGGLLGFGLGGLVAHARAGRTKASVLGDGDNVRLVVGRFAPEVWFRIVTAATVVETSPGGSRGTGTGEQAAEAVHGALWESAGLLLRSSDHTGVGVLADGVERLAKAQHE